MSLLEQAVQKKKDEMKAQEEAEQLAKDKEAREKWEARLKFYTAEFHRNFPTLFGDPACNAKLNNLCLTFQYQGTTLHIEEITRIEYRDEWAYDGEREWHVVKYTPEYKKIYLEPCNEARLMEVLAKYF